MLSGCARLAKASSAAFCLECAPLAQQRRPPSPVLRGVGPTPEGGGDHFRTPNASLASLSGSLSAV